MDVFEAIRTVVAVRQYRDSPIPGNAIRRIVEAGRLTASSQNKQPWHFIVVQDRRRLLELAQLAQELGYDRVWLFDSAALYEDIWIWLARLAEHTDLTPEQIHARVEEMLDQRSEERRVGKECSLPCRSRWSPDRKSTRLNSSHSLPSRMPSSA